MSSWENIHSLASLCTLIFWSERRIRVGMYSSACASFDDDSGFRHVPYLCASHYLYDVSLQFGFCSQGTFLGTACGSFPLLITVWRLVYSQYRYWLPDERDYLLQSRKDCLHILVGELCSKQERYFLVLGDIDHEAYVAFSQAYVPYFCANDFEV